MSDTVDSSTCVAASCGASFWSAASGVPDRVIASWWSTREASTATGVAFAPPLATCTVSEVSDSPTLLSTTVRQAQRAAEDAFDTGYSAYWSAVFDVRCAETVLKEFDLLASDHLALDLWIGHAEADAWDEVGEGDIPDEWSAFHARALEELSDASKAAPAAGHVGSLRSRWPGD